MSVKGSRAIQLSSLLVASLVVAMLVGVARAQLGGDENKLPDNPYANVPQEEIWAIQNQLRTEFGQKYQAWLEEFIVSGRDARSLERRELSAFYLDPEKDLASAARRADLIVVGSIEGVVYEAFVGATLQVKVETFLKNSLSDTLKVRQQSSPFPDENYSIGVLASSPAEIPLFEGDRAVLLLELVNGDYYALPFTGTYLSAGGKITAVEGNPFRSVVHAKSEQELITRLRAATR